MIQNIAKPKKKVRTEIQLTLAQYFTPQPIAEFMSSMFETSASEVKILDPGAGEGILGLTLYEKLKNNHKQTTFVEFDKQTSITLQEIVNKIIPAKELEVVNDDFIEKALDLEKRGEKFTHVILNPPYFKLKVGNTSSSKLRNNGIQVTNIYAAFVWLSARLLESDGQLVAIIPRSFCNGTYFLSFREFIADNLSIDWIHIFSSRDKAFSQDHVLQENIIIRLSKRKQINKVKLSYSNDQSFTNTTSKNVPFDLIISPTDKSKTILIPAYDQTLKLDDYLPGNLIELGITASTGPIVDFRLKESIVDSPTKNSIPLLYPAHMSGHETQWPLTAFKKIGQHYKPSTENTTSLTFEGIIDTFNDRNILPLDGYYVVVRRFSSKEEKRRIFASVVCPENFKSKYITFENHLNYFHSKKHGFDKELAYGLCAYLNSTLLDEHFRKLSGHTQVNVGDLKGLPYPAKEQLQKLGSIMRNIDGLIDDIVTKELLGATT